ncbi:unnamed protein product [Pedinophyceae sp. YPF-701]|nr:unnamed protein product [Pedinophyceae sp. YPF-701]
MLLRSAHLKAAFAAALLPFLLAGVIIVCTADSVHAAAADTPMTESPSAGSTSWLLASARMLGKVAVFGGKALVGLYAVAAGAMFVFQRKLLFIPEPAWSDDILRRYFGDLSFEGLEDVKVHTQDGKTLRCDYWPAPATPRGPRNAALSGVTLLMFHGNAGNRQLRRPWVRELRSILGCGIMMVDYRGYGGSEGSPSQAGFCADARAAVKWLRARLADDARKGLVAPSHKVVYYGESIGTGVSTYLASVDAPDGVILHAPFSSAVDAAATLKPMQVFPIRLLMRDRFPSTTWCKKWPKEMPSLILHGTADDLVPLRLGRKLFDAIPAEKGIKAMVEIEGAGHNDVPDFGLQYYQPIIHFLSEKVVGRG